MQPSRTIIGVKPIFSLKEIGEMFIDNEVLEYKKDINKALSKYDRNAVPKSLTLSALNSNLKNRSAMNSVPFDIVFKTYGDKQYLLADTSFLLGLVQHQDFLRRIQDINSIEVLENKTEGLFKGVIGKRPLQLCLRRVGLSYIVCISQYIQRGHLNAFAGMSTNAVNILTFAEEKILDQDEIPKVSGINSVDDWWKNEMIG